MSETNTPLLDLKVGDEILVQVTKPPRGNKGAKVTTNLSIVGKNLIYLPNTEFVGISRKITDEKIRERVLLEVNKLRKGKDGEGVIIRTQAPLAGHRKLKSEWRFLQKLWLDLLDRAKTAPVGQVLHKDLDTSCNSNSYKENSDIPNT